MKYLKLFETDSERVEYEGGGSYIEPYVSYVEGVGVYYNKDEIATDLTNLPLMNIARAQGWVEQDATAMTKADAAAVTTEQFNAANYVIIGEWSTTSTFSALTSFNEFKYFTNVTSIEFNNDNYTGGFYYATNLSEITIPNSVTNIGSSAFTSCSGLTSIVIPNGVTSIGDDAFSNCYGLTEVTIPNGVTSIGSSAFGACTGVTSVTIPNSVTSIGNGAFASCVSLTGITIPNSVTYIGSGAFQYCNFTGITIPNSVTYIGSYALSSCENLTNVTIPSSVVCIGSNAFDGTPWWNAYSADTSHRYNNIIYINDVAYQLLDKTITSITFRENTIGIAGSFFHSCYRITSVGGVGSGASIEIPNSVQAIGNDAFGSCTGITSVTIPDNVTLIDERAFDNCNKMERIIIGNGVTGISESLFSQCRKLNSVTIGNGVTSIGTYAFYSCSALTSINMSSGVTSIGEYAFGYCSGLTSIDIPSGVTSIGNGAFSYCSNLASITSLAATAPTITFYTFSNVKTGGTLTVPSGSTGYDVWMQNANYYLGLYNWTKVEQ